MFTIISALSTPLIIINAGCHYLSWSAAAAKKELQTEAQRQAVYKTHRLVNTLVAAGIFAIGTISAVVVACVLQTATPLILTAMALRIAAIAAIAAAVFIAGEVTNDLCRRLSGGMVLC